ncbi:hypothetical protein ACIHFE_17795 [Streptomyces sp. NPDC052396]|uniref:hypothetical protein n=1 Tax=Streptomyces sp. NPDC052396 TaxID=3365689 RepID=UPI0037D94585
MAATVECAGAQDDPECGNGHGDEGAEALAEVHRFSAVFLLAYRFKSSLTEPPLTFRT